MAGEHGELTTTEGIHIPYQWSYADAAARTGATGFTAGHVGKLARQLDNDTLWMLTATTPAWVQVSGNAIAHDTLTGLADDDHTQYLLADGSRAMSGSLDMGTLAITNVGNVDGRDVSADGSKLDGIEAGATADQTPAEILADLLTVDGSGSLLDADLLDNKEATDFLLTTGAQAGATSQAQDFGANGILADNLADSSGGGIAVADDMTLAQGKTVNLQGASGGPQSGTARDVLAKIGHILDGGHPANPYPATRDADDAEFNNAVQAENNTIGTHAGGDFWEWNSTPPNPYNINSSRLNYLYYSKQNADSGTDRHLKGAITSPAASGNYYAQALWLIDGLNFSADFYVGLRLYDSNSTKYIAIRYGVFSSAVKIEAVYFDTSTETTITSVTGLPKNPPIVSLFLRRYVPTTTVFHQSFYSFSLAGDYFSSSLTANNTSILAADLIPDEVWLEFSNSGGGVQQFNVDSFRRLVP